MTLTVSGDIRRLWDMVDGPMPRGILGLGDPDVHIIDDVPTMFLGGFSTSFRNRLYRATAEPGGGSRPSWRVVTDRGDRAEALVADPPKGAWDAAGMHTPSYVLAVDDQPARLYYTGRASSKQYGPGSSYAIGALDHVDGRWQRRPDPLVRGRAPRLSVLEPQVVYDQGRYVMWFQANRHEIGPGELPDHELQVTESADGLTWSDPAVFASSADGFFDNTITRIDGGWLMVLARSADLHDTDGMPEQGLWISTASELSADRRDWTTPRHVLRTDEPGTPEWMARGVYGPGIHQPAGSSEITVYVTAVRDTPRWPVYLARRLLHGRRPVVPSPFYLSVAAVPLTAGSATRQSRRS